MHSPAWSVTMSREAPETLQLAQDPGDGGIVPHLQGGKLVGGQLALLDHGAFLVFIKEPLA